MEAQRVLRTYINLEIERRRQRNSAYSMRSFAKSVDIHPAALSQFLNGKRKLSLTIAEKILSKISDDPTKKAEVLDSFEINDLSSNNAKDILQLEADQYHIVSDPSYYSILSLFETTDLVADPKWVSERLGLSIHKVEKSFERLIRLGFLVENENAELCVHDKELDTPYDNSNLVLRERQKKNLTDASTALDEIHHLFREACAVTMAIDPDKIPEAKKRIREFRDSMCEYLETGNRTEVYELSIQMFPRSKIRMNTEDPDESG